MYVKEYTNINSLGNTFSVSEEYFSSRVTPRKKPCELLHDLNFRSDHQCCSGITLRALLQLLLGQQNKNIFCMNIASCRVAIPRYWEELLSTDVREEREELFW